jgi:soluble lytic murein transglycosylase-like protein
MIKTLIILLLLTTSLNAQSLTDFIEHEYKYQFKQLGIKQEHYLKNSKKYSHIIKLASHKSNIPVHLIEAIITVESRWDAKAKGDENCNGLMQIKKGTFHVGKNILSGTAIFKNYLMQCEYDTLRALTCYKFGLKGMERYYREHGHTSNYAIRAYKIYELLKDYREFKNEKMITVF